MGGEQQLSYNASMKPLAALLSLTPASAVYAAAYTLGVAAFCLFARQRRLLTEGMLTVAMVGLIGGLLGANVGQLLATGGNPGKSVLGGVAGGYLAVWLGKKHLGLARPTGDLFAVALMAGEAVGRWGCLFAGLADQTYGVATRLPWGVDLGDGVSRHPVEIYESLAMALFLAVTVAARQRGAAWASTRVFYAFVIWYGAQRFGLEFLKPYPKLIGPFNLFHALSTGFILYGIAWWRSADRRTQGGGLSVPQPDDQLVRNLSRTGAGQSDPGG